MNKRPFKSDDLLIKRSGLPFKTKDIQTVINRATGKQIGCTLLRSIFLTSKYGDVMNELKHDTESMATSVDTARTTYIKSDWNIFFEIIAKKWKGGVWEKGGGQGNNWKCISYQNRSGVSDAHWSESEAVSWLPTILSSLYIEGDGWWVMGCFNFHCSL